ncbi:MAG: endolytic transglycosylase MltG [Deltaproteobacteria bacterium HGW-Deltaproteobacteria-23]|nr:MAG: endolytic transglycosylase MltG [Deltaproteobacteria bacterium HGW-Deltaproteobacteria-23]
MLPKIALKELLSGKKRYLYIFFVLIAAFSVGRFAFFLYTPQGDGRNIKIVDFAKGSPLKKLAADLEKEGLISSATLFTLYAKVSGVAGKLQAGTYKFNDALTPPEMMRKLAVGDVFEKRFAVPEGYSIFQVAEMLDSRGFFNKEPFLKECRNPALLKELGIKAASVEGFLYPSTYSLLKIETPADLIRQMTGQFSKIYTEKFSETEQNSRLSRLQIITLASIVEKEAVVPEEMPIIASVFHNRLKKGMPLQSDPTAVYGVRAFSGRVSGSDVRRDSPYNTYLIKGLPPGPIGNPGAAAIEAVLRPMATGYYYFVAKNDGTHHFSVSLDEHNRAVQRYLKGGAAQTGSPELKNDRPNITGRR